MRRFVYILKRSSRVATFVKPPTGQHRRSGRPAALRSCSARRLGGILLRSVSTRAISPAVAHARRPRSPSKWSTRASCNVVVDDFPVREQVTTASTRGPSGGSRRADAVASERLAQLSQGRSEFQHRDVSERAGVSTQVTVLRRIETGLHQDPFPIELPKPLGHRPSELQPQAARKPGRTCIACRIQRGPLELDPAPPFDRVSSAGRRRDDLPHDERRHRKARIDVLGQDWLTATRAKAMSTQQARWRCDSYDISRYFRDAESLALSARRHSQRAQREPPHIRSGEQHDDAQPEHGG